MSATAIEWTDRTWNPVTGCTKVSPGCDHCYAEGIARRFAGTKAFPNGFDVTLHSERLGAPMRWRKPARVFVNSMSDLFHAKIPDRFIADVFAVMAVTPRHTYQVLTKRPGRMRSLLRSPGFFDLVAAAVRVRGEVYSRDLVGWPLPNVWMGVSVEDQKWAGVRVPLLLDTPAAIRFLSCEPLLGAVDLGIGDPHRSHSRDFISDYDAICLDCSGTEEDGDEEDDVRWFTREVDEGWNGLHWVIVGGESGPGARPMKLRWARTIVQECQSVGVPVFVKQLGSAHGPSKGGPIETWPAELQVREYPMVVAS